MDHSVARKEEKSALNWEKIIKYEIRQRNPQSGCQKSTTFEEMVQKNRKISNLHGILRFLGCLMKKKMKNLDLIRKFLRFDTVELRGGGERETIG